MTTSYQPTLGRTTQAMNRSPSPISSTHVSADMYLEAPAGVLVPLDRSYLCQRLVLEIHEHGVVVCVTTGEHASVLNEADSSFHDVRAQGEYAVSLERCQAHALADSVASRTVSRS